MTYYIVQPFADQLHCSLRFKKQFLVAGELYTQGEVNKAIKAGCVTKSFIEQNFDTIDISPRKTYWFFGARKPFHELQPK